MSQQANIAKNAHLPLYVPPISAALVRTRNPIRPEWLDEIKRPLRVVAIHEVQYNAFLARWRIDPSESIFVREVHQLHGLNTSSSILVLDGADDSAEFTMEVTSPTLMWKHRGGLTIKIPWSAIKWNGQGFSDEENMIASTIVQMAKQRHLDSLNRK